MNTIKMEFIKKKITRILIQKTCSSVVSEIKVHQYQLFVLFRNYSCQLNNVVLVRCVNYEGGRYYKH